MTVEELIAKQTRIERCVPALRACDMVHTKHKSHRRKARAGRRRRTAHRCRLSGMRPTRSSATWLAPSTSASSAAACCMAVWARAAMCAWMRSMSCRRCRPCFTLQCMSLSRSALQMQGVYPASCSRQDSMRHGKGVVVSRMRLLRATACQARGGRGQLEWLLVSTACCACRRAVRTVCSWSGALNRSSAPTSLLSAWGANLHLLAQTGACTDHSP